jgi:pyruvate formate lyase activating enzyme
MPRIAMATTSLKDVLQTFTKEGELYEKLENNRLRCYACGHRCVIFDGLDGICRVRFNRGGTLYVPHGYVGALQLDPVEKKPFFHALPGALAMSFGMLGCDFHCAYCQNWVTSQALRDSNAVAPPHTMTARQFVSISLEQGARIVTSTYNEPLITSEWAVEVFREARQAGLKTSYVSNGNGTPEVLEYIKPWVDLYKVDLKGFQDRNYRKLGGVLNNVLDTIGRLYSMGFWLEIVTLIIPGFNDGDEELRDMARFLAGVSPDIPWHVTAFHQDYKMTDPDNTSANTLLHAAEIGKTEGLNFVYAGNLPGRVNVWENTYCPGCHKLLIERYGYRIQTMQIKDGACPKCSRRIPGVWN